MNKYLGFNEFMENYKMNEKILITSNHACVNQYVRKCNESSSNKNSPLHYRFFKGVRHFTKIGSVNGQSLLLQEKREWLAKNMNQITISMDGFENIQNQQRPHRLLNSYDEVFETIKALDKNNI